MSFARTGKYGVQTDYYFRMVVAGGTDYATSSDWTPASGDVKIVKDGGTAANTTNLPSYIASSGVWKITLTATEQQAANISISIIDSATKAVEDNGLEITTFGNASAKIQPDLTNTYLGVDVINWKGATAPAMTGDAYARLGAPAGASVSADIAANAAAIDAVDNYVDTEIAAILSDTSGIATILTTLGTGGDGLTAITGALGTPSDLGSGATLADMLADMAGATFSTTTDTLEAIRNRGDAAWTTYDGSDTSGTTTLLSRLTATRAGYLDNLSAGAVATASALSTVGTNVSTLLTRIPAALFSGITSLAEWLGMIAGKQSPDATAQTEIRATGAGSGTYDATTDSLEALQAEHDQTQTDIDNLNDIAAADIVSGGAITTSGGAVSSVTTVGSVTTKTGYALASTGLDAVIAPDPSAAIPTLGTSSIVAWLGFFAQQSVGEWSSDASDVTLRNSADSADLATYTHSDDGTTYTQNAAT